MLTKIIDKYIFAKVGKIFLFTLSILTMLVWLAFSLRFIELITTKGLSIWVFFKLTMLLILPMMFILIPLSGLFAAIIAINGLIHDREIIVLKSCGYSDSQILRPIFTFGVGISLFTLIVSAYLMPLSYKEFKDMQNFFRNKYVSLLLEDGVFNNQLSDRIIYIEERVDKQHLKGIFIYDRKNRDKAISIVAESGEVTFTSLGPKFVLYNGTYQEESKNSKKINFTAFNSYHFDLITETDDEAKREIYDYNEITLPALISLAKENANLEPGLIGQINHRLIWPFYALILSLVGASTLLKLRFSRRASLKEPLIAGAIGGAVAMLAIFVANSSFKNEHLLILPYILIFTLSFTLSWYVKSYR
jgi:lipopolysaccharide export system permease protein